MTSDLYGLVCREGGGGGRRRTKGPRRRPRFVAHPAQWWDAETTAEHLEACRTGRGPDGEWKDWSDMTEGERWSWYWEAFPPRLGPTVEIEVP